MKNKILNWLKKYIGPHSIFIKTFKKSPPFRYLTFGVLLLFAPLLIEADLMEYSALSVIALLLIYTIVALGLNLLLGFSGLISLGTAGFVGFGAYGIVFFSNEYSLSFFAATILTLIVAAMIGALIGLFSLKVEGIYLAIATLFVGEIFFNLISYIIQCSKNKIPIVTRTLSIFFTISFIVRKIISTPVMFTVTTDHQLTIFLSKS